MYGGNSLSAVEIKSKKGGYGQTWMQT